MTLKAQDTRGRRSNDRAADPSRVNLTCPFCEWYRIVDYELVTATLEAHRRECQVAADTITTEG